MHSDAGSQHSLTGLNSEITSPTLTRSGTSGLTSTQETTVCVNLLEHIDAESQHDLSVSHLKLVSGNESGITIALNGIDLIIDPSSYDDLPEGQTETIQYQYRLIDLEQAYTFHSINIILEGSLETTVIKEVQSAHEDEPGALLRYCSPDPVSDDRDTISKEPVTTDSVVNPDNDSEDVKIEEEAEIPVSSPEIDHSDTNDSERSPEVIIQNTGVDTNAEKRIFITHDSSSYIFTVSDFISGNLDQATEVNAIIIVSLPVAGNLLFNGSSVSIDFEVTPNDLLCGRLKWTEGSHRQTDTIDFEYRLSATESETIEPETTICDAPALALYTARVKDHVAVTVGDELLATGKLLLDNGPSADIRLKTATSQGLYGSLLIDSRGGYTYSANKNQSAFELLMSDAPDSDTTLSDILTVYTEFGEPQDITIQFSFRDNAIRISDAWADQEPEQETALLPENKALDQVDHSVFRFKIPEDTFTGLSGNNLMYSASLRDGSTLPQWLEFNTGALTFNGIPENGIPDNGIPDVPHTGILPVCVRANDGTSIIAVDFDLKVTEENAGLMVSEHPLLNGIVTALNFNTGAGRKAFDSSGCENNGVLVGSADWVVDRHNKNNALHMAGEDAYVELPGMQTGGAMTVAAWVRFESFDQAWSRIFDFGNDQATDNILLGHKASSSTLGFYIYNESGKSEAAALEAEDFFVLGDWQHVTVTVDELGIMSAYKNGELVSEAAGVVPEKMIRTGNFIGRSHWSGDGYFEGTVDDFVVIDNALDAQQVKTLYQVNAVENLIHDSFYMAEDSDDGTLIGTVTLVDDQAVGNENLTFTLTEDADQRFTIDNSSGEIRLVDSGRIGVEGISEYAVTAAVSLGNRVGHRDYTIHVIKEPHEKVTDSTSETNPLMAFGQLNVNHSYLIDTDEEEPFYTATTLTGAHGILVLTEEGHWSYSINETREDVTELAMDACLKDGFDIISADRALHQIAITIIRTDSGIRIDSGRAQK